MDRRVCTNAIQRQLEELTAIVKQKFDSMSALQQLYFKGIHSRVDLIRACPIEKMSHLLEELNLVDQFIKVVEQAFKDIERPAREHRSAGRPDVTWHQEQNQFHRQQWQMLHQETVNQFQHQQHMQQQQHFY